MSIRVVITADGKALLAALPREMGEEINTRRRTTQSVFTQRIQCESCKNVAECHEMSARYAVDELPEPWLVIAFAPVRGAQYLHFCSQPCALVWLAKRIAGGPKDVVEPGVNRESYERA